MVGFGSERCLVVGGAMRPSGMAQAAASDIAAVSLSGVNTVVDARLGVY